MITEKNKETNKQTKRLLDIITNEFNVYALFENTLKSITSVLIQKIFNYIYKTMTSYHQEEDSFTIGGINELEKQRFFRLALNEENEVNTLLSYYRNRIGRFDSEREDWLDKYNKLRTTQDEAHRQEWELQKRVQEVAELRRTLEEEKLRLYDERQGIIDLIKENDQLKIKELEDRKKISELTALGGSVDQEIVFYKDVKPGKLEYLTLIYHVEETITRYGKTDLSLKSNLENYENTLKK